MTAPNRSTLRRSALLATAFALSVGASASMAEVGNGDAWDLRISLKVLGIDALNVTPVSQAAFSNMATPWAQWDQKPGIDVGSAAVARVTTGLLTSEAEYRPGPSFSAVAAEGQVAALDLQAVGLLGASLLSLKADVIRSKSIVAGYCLVPSRAGGGLLDDVMFGNGFDSGNLGTGGDGSPGTGPDDSAELANVELKILGIRVPIPLNPPPNTGIDLSQLGIAGVTLILNEQTLGGDGVTARTKTSNGLRLTLNILGTITGEVIVAHASAGIDCSQ